MLLRKEDVEMRTEYDFSPLFRSTVGFDRLFNLLQHATPGGELIQYLQRSCPQVRRHWAYCELLA